MAFCFSKAQIKPINPMRLKLDRLVDQVMDHGRYAFQQLAGNSIDSHLLSNLVDSGYLQTSPESNLQPTNRFLQQCERVAFLNLQSSKHFTAAGHVSVSNVGPGNDDRIGLRNYQFGDRLDQIDWLNSIRQRIQRQLWTGNLSDCDLLVWEEDVSTSCATVILLDLSGSMNRYGKFARARQVTLAMRKLVRTYYPDDMLQVIGFATLPKLLSGFDLLLETPRSVNLVEDTEKRRYSVASDNKIIPGHFTNLQAGLIAARHWLLKQGNRHRQILCITDGEPTAHLEGNEVVLAFPSVAETIEHTIKEVARCVREEIRVQFVGLIEDSLVTGLKSILDRLASRARVPAVYCGGTQLGSLLLTGFVAGREQGPRPSSQGY